MIAVITLLAVSLGFVAVVLHLRQVRRRLEERYETRLGEARSHLRFAAFTLQFDHPEAAQIFDAAEELVRTGKKVDLQELRQMLDHKERVARARALSVAHHTVPQFRRDGE